MIDPFNLDTKEINKNTKRLLLSSKSMEIRDNNLILAISIGFIFTIFVFAYVFNLFPQKTSYYFPSFINDAQSKLNTFAPIDSNKTLGAYSVDNNQTDLSNTGF